MKKDVVAGLAGILISCFSLSGCQTITTDLVKQEADFILRNPEQARKIFKLKPEETYQIIDSGENYLKIGVIRRDGKEVIMYRKDEDGKYQRVTVGGKLKVLGVFPPSETKDTQKKPYVHEKDNPEWVM